MPGYTVHRIFNYAVFIIIAVILYLRNLLFPNIVQFIVWSGGFYIGTDFITPDLDIESKAINRWGPLKVLWLPYKWIFKHGQSSHNIVYGAVVRILYISLIILGIYYIIFKSLPTDISVSLFPVLIFIGGIILANALHIVLDMLF